MWGNKTKTICTTLANGRFLLPLKLPHKTVKSSLPLSPSLLRQSNLLSPTLNLPQHEQETPQWLLQAFSLPLTFGSPRPQDTRIPDSSAQLRFPCRVKNCLKIKRTASDWAKTQRDAEVGKLAPTLYFIKAASWNAVLLNECLRHSYLSRQQAQRGWKVPGASDYLFLIFWSI